MRAMLVTCPDSAHLEQLELEDHPLGMLLVSCTRFSPASAVTCDRVCIARLDAKRRLSSDVVDEEDPEIGDDTLVRIRR